MLERGVGQRAARTWGSYSLGEIADAAWRTCDVLGSGIEPVSVYIEPPRSAEDLPVVQVVVREAVDVAHLRSRLREYDAIHTLVDTAPQVWTAVVDEIILIVKLDRES